MQSLASTLFDYICNPVKTIQTRQHIPPTRLALLILGFLSITSLNNLVPIQSLFIQSIFMFSLLILCILFQACCIDFISQLQHSKSQLIPLISWLSMALLPFLILHPLNTLADVLQLPLFFSDLYYWAVLYLSVFLQIKTIQILYRYYSFKSTLIWFSPLLIIGVLILSIAGLTFTSMGAY